MANVKVETWCHHCARERQYEHDYEAPFECPDCGSPLMRQSYIVCEECGEVIYLRGFTNQCGCGALYNGFGQRLADPDEWDEEDRYDSFGPQDLEPLDYME